VLLLGGLIFVLPLSRKFSADALANVGWAVLSRLRMFVENLCQFSVIVYCLQSMACDFVSKPPRRPYCSCAVILVSTSQCCDKNDSPNRENFIIKCYYQLVYFFTECCFILLICFQIWAKRFLGHLRNLLKCFGFYPAVSFGFSVEGGTLSRY